MESCLTTLRICFVAAPVLYQLLCSGDVRFDQVFFEQLGKADALEKKLMEFNSTLVGSAVPEQR